MLPRKPRKKVEANKGIWWDFIRMGSYSGLSGLLGDMSGGKKSCDVLAYHCAFPLFQGADKIVL